MARASCAGRGDQACGPRLAARRDLNEIRAYTVERWGEAQWLRYCRGLVATFERIEADPMTGRGRDLFRPGMRSVTYERHIVFFAPHRRGRRRARGAAPPARATQARGIELL